MAKKLTSKQKKEQLNNLFAQYNLRLGMLYSSYVKQLTALGYEESVLEGDALFNFDNFPQFKERLNDIFNDYYQNSLLCYKNGMTDGVALAFSHDTNVLGAFSVLSDKAIRVVRDNAAATFIKSRFKSSKGLNLAQSVWNYCQQTKSEFEMAMSNVIADGIKGGTSAEELGRQLRKYLNNPDMMYRRYHTVKVLKNGQKKDVVTWRRRRVIDGKVRFVEEPLEKVGMGVYRSARKNAFRVARTEINAAYLRGHNERWRNEPFVIGQFIHVSPQHVIDDICNELEGRYPKDFIFASWHPNCYVEGTQVLTKNGWKLFKDVVESDEILSLNPQTRETEYTGIEQMQKYQYKGKLVRFHNRSLECLVTPEHQMVYINKWGDHGIRRCTANEYSKNKGAFYRSAENNTEDKKEIWFGDRYISFDLYCEFMGYYLADGSMMRDYGIVLSQKQGEPAWEKIQQCIRNLGFEPHISKETIIMYHRAYGRCLLQFGKAHDKFIPQEILTASKRQIRIFLDAFVLCDGSVRNPHSFMGNRGNIFVPRKQERIYFTVSPQMAADLGVLLLRIGHRPSYNMQCVGTSTKKDGTIIKSNYPCYRISECYAATSTVFDKEYVDYDGLVYDLTLEKNHIMYIQKNGKCFWGSNCMCTSDPIMIEGEEKKEFYKRLMAGEDMSNYISPFAVTDTPPAYKQYIEGNEKAIMKAFRGDKLAWHLADNKKYWQRFMSPENQKEMGYTAKSARELILESAEKRHAQRTQEQIDKIQGRWDKHRRDYYNSLVDKITGGKFVGDIKSKDLFERYYKIRVAIKDHKSVDEVEKIFNRFKQGYETKLAWTDRKVAMNVLKTAKKYGETDFSNVQALLQAADYAKAREAAKTLAKQIKAVQQDEVLLAKLIPDVNKWHKQFTSQELHGVYDAVESKLAQWNSLTLEKQASKLKFEAEDFLGGNMHGVQQKYATWQVSQAAYFKKLEEVNDAIDWININNLYADVSSYKTQSKIYHKMVYDLKNAIVAKDKDLADNLLAEAIQKKEALINAKAKRNAKNVKFDTDAFSQARKDAAVWDKGTGATADKTLIDTAGKQWVAATGKEKDFVYEYTSHYCDVNEPLQGRMYSNPQKKERFIEKVNNITSYIEKNELPSDMWFTRGDSSIEVIKSRIEFAGGSMPSNLQDLVGMEMQEGGFMSTGSRKGKGFSSRSVILNIYAPKGTKAAYLEPISAYGNGACRNWNGVERFSSYSSEHETLFQRGTKMRITKVYQEGSKTYIDCEVVGQELKDLSYVKDSNIGY